MVNLIKFDIKNREHIVIKEKLSLDNEINNNVLSICFLNDNSYVICNDSINIGILKINKELNDYYSIDIGILDEYTNKGYGAEVLRKTLDIIKKLDWNKVIFRTSYDNDKAINCALRANFSYDLEEIEKTMNEGCSNLVLSIKNTNYKVKCKEK